MVKLYCLNDKHRPAEIPASKWPKEGQWYTLEWIYWHPAQGVQGVDLKEFVLDESNLPFNSYKLGRFAIPIESLDEFAELLSVCSSAKASLEAELENIEVIPKKIEQA